MIGNNFVLLVAVFVFGWGQLCECQVFFGGECVDVEHVQNFDVNKYMGSWYEYQRYPSDLEKTNKCNMDYYNLKSSGDVTVLKSKFNTLGKNYVELLGIASNFQSGNMNVQFKDAAAAARSRFWVVDTDYTNFSVLYACVPITNHYHTKMVWIMTREKNPKPDAVLKAFRTMARNRLPTSYLSRVDQTGCSARAGLIDKIMEFV